MELRKLNVDDVEVKIFAEDEDIPIRGSFDSGDPKLDEETAKEIEARLNRGDIWAWCNVRVQVSYGSCFVATSSHLGACSYKNEKDFVKNSGYYDSLVEEALDDLNVEVQETFEKLKPLVIRW